MPNNRREIKLDFGNGIVSIIDEHVQKLIIDLQKQIDNPSKIPFFWNLSQSLNSLNEDFLKFYSFLLANAKLSKSQLFQDLFVIYTLKEKTKGTFLEFGACDGIKLSNTHLLESKYKWKGVLAEPCIKWHKSLKKNRKNCHIINDCIYTETGVYLDFFSSDVGELSTLEQFKESDTTSMPGNAKLRNQNGYNHKVFTISLNDVFVKYFNSLPIDYMSVDTEGSELMILEKFDFEKFSPKIVTVEHNFSDVQEKLDVLFSKNNYVRVFRDYTQFDAWYVLKN